MEQNLPTKLKILGKTYKIKYQHLSDDWGKLYSDQTVVIDKTAHPESMKETLLHEILHIIFDDMGIILKKKEEENIISKISPVLYQVIEDNKLFRK